jgi:putative hydrolase of the HAD superfamily
MRFADVDAVTVDGYGTLLTLRDPVDELRRALRRHGVERNDESVERGFRVEVAYYAANKQRAHDDDGLARLRERCAGIFLEAVDAPLDPRTFVAAFIDALVFEPLAGALETLDALAARGLTLGVVANWDVSLRSHLERLGWDSRFATVVLSPEVGVEKPDPRPFQVALAKLGVAPERSVHVGDDEVDERGAAAAGMRFVPAPLEHAFAGWR